MRFCLVLAVSLCGAALAAEELETVKWQSAIDETAKAGGGRVTAGRRIWNDTTCIF